MTELNKVFSTGIVLKAAKSFSEKAPAVFTIKVPRANGVKGYDFIPVKAFGDLKEIAINNLSENVVVYIEGHLQSGSYEKDGRKVYTLDLIASNIEPAELPKVEEQEPQRKGWG